MSNILKRLKIRTSYALLWSVVLASVWSIESAYSSESRKQLDKGARQPSSVFTRSELNDPASQPPSWHRSVTGLPAHSKSNQIKAQAFGQDVELTIVPSKEDGSEFWRGIPNLGGK